MKKYTSIMMASIILFLIFHLFVWHTNTGLIFDNKSEYRMGDLVRLSYQTQYASELYKRVSIVDLSKRHTQFNYQKSLDIITVGDSFSSGAGGGKNGYYQDYITANFDLSIANVPLFNGNVRPTFETLLSDEFLNEYKPKAMLLESVQREFLNRFAPKFSPKQYRLKDITSMLDSHNMNLKAQSDEDKNFFRFITKLNYNSILYSIAYQFSDNAFWSKTYIVKLTDYFFKHEYGDQLLFYNKDVLNLENDKCVRAKKAIETINRYAEILSEKGIDLFLLIAPDKYHLYYPYIENRGEKYQQDKLFDCLRSADLKFKYIDAENKLVGAIKNGQKEVYMMSDTHWSHRASEVIFSTSPMMEELKRK